MVLTGTSAAIARAKGTSPHPRLAHARRRLRLRPGDAGRGMWAPARRWARPARRWTMTARAPRLSPCFRSSPRPRCARSTRAPSRALGIPGPRLMEAAGTGAARIIAAPIRRPMRGRRRCRALRQGEQRRRRLRRRAPAARRGRARAGVPRGPPGRGAGDAARALARWTGRVDEIGGRRDLDAVDARAGGRATSWWTRSSGPGDGGRGPARG